MQKIRTFNILTKTVGNWQQKARNLSLFMKKILSILTLFLFCISCATPTVVNVIGPNDNEMSCKELSSEIF